MVHREVEQHSGIAGKIVGIEGNGLVDIAKVSLEHRLEQLFLAAEIVVDQAFVRGRRPGDTVDPRAGDAVGSEFLGRGLQDTRLGSLRFRQFGLGHRSQHFN